VDLIGPGYYTAPLGAGANVTLSLGPDNNTVMCAYTLGSPVSFGLNVLNVTVVVTDGPVYAADDPLYTGNPSAPYWQLEFLNVSTTGAPTGLGSVLLSQALNASVARSYTRIVDCVVTGFNNQTGLPFTLPSAQSYVVETYGQGWLPYSYPMPGNYTYSGPQTKQPTTAPTQRPTASPTTLSPTQSPTVAPTFCEAPAPVAPLHIGFSVLSPVVTSDTVVPGSNSFSGYAAGSAIVDYDVTTGLVGGWNNTSFEYVAPSTGCVSLAHTYSPCMDSPDR
jgi:hypothetical protein